jgi:hypothetical protein
VAVKATATRKEKTLERLKCDRMRKSVIHSRARERKVVNNNGNIYDGELNCFLRGWQRNEKQNVDENEEWREREREREKLFGSREK